MHESSSEIVFDVYFFWLQLKGCVTPEREINVITPTYIPAHHYTYISAHLHDCGHLMAGGRQKCLLWVGGQLLVDGSSSRNNIN